MGFDITNGPDLAGFDPRLASYVDSGSMSSAADAAELAPFSGDSIAASPLAMFGGVIEQIGQTLQAGTTANPADPANANAPGMHDAIDMLESVMALMSAYGGDPNETLSTLPPGTPGATPQSLDAARGTAALD